MKIIDRYLIREILLPFFLVLLVLTFMLEIPPILQQAEPLIAKGVAWSIIARILLTLVPQALGITIPMALLIGVLIGLGRFSADREFVALQACGVSIFRLLRPLSVLAVVGWAATSWVMIVALPDANQAFRQITFNVVAAHAGSDIKPGVFFEEFPNRVIYTRSNTQGGGWRDVFLADATNPDETTVYLARQGRLLIDREKQTVELLLEDGTRHTTFASRPDEYEGAAFERSVLSMNPETVFPKISLVKGEPEMTFAELRASIAEAAQRGDPGYNQKLMIQQKFSIPIACPVLVLLGLGLGVTSRKDGKLASFVLGFGVIFVYYVLLWTARSLTKGAWVPATLAPWIPNIVLGAAGLMLLAWRAGSAHQPIRIALPSFRRGRTTAPASREPGAASQGQRGPVLVIRLPHLNLPRPGLLDLYVSQTYVRMFALAFVGLLGLFYVSTFVDLMEKLIRGTATGGQMLRFFYFSTPQFIYYIIPISALLSTLVTIGLLTKNSELIVMRACGVSLYRSALPLLVFALAASGVLFTLQEQVLAGANRQAEALRHVMRGLPARTFGLLDRRWVIGTGGDIHHYELFDPRSNRFTRLTDFHLDAGAWRLQALTFAKDVALVRQPSADSTPALAWQARNGWSREFVAGRRKNTVKYQTFATRTIGLEPPSYFKTDEPEPERMTYGQLKRYIVQLQSSGFQVVPYVVALQRKIAFPFVTLIMTLLAVPFAVTTGRRGALYGVGVGIVLAIVYWVTLSIFAAIGSGGAMPPMLAAWAPNILFGAAAGYLILTVRT